MSIKNWIQLRKVSKYMRAPWHMWTTFWNFGISFELLTVTIFSSYRME